MSREDLIPFNQRTEDEQKEIAKKGGIASGVARRRKRSLKEVADLYLALPVADDRRRNIARRISEAGQLTSSAAYQIWRAQKLGMSQREVKKKLQKILKTSRKEINKLLTQSAEVGYRFDLDKLPTSAAIPFEKNSSLQQIVEAAVKLAQDDFTNLTQTLGMVDPYGNALPLQDVYRSCTDFAFEQVITGATDYNTAIRRAPRTWRHRACASLTMSLGYIPRWKRLSGVISWVDLA